MTTPIADLKARIETFEYIIDLCERNPVGSRQLMNGELAGMRSALALFEPKSSLGDGGSMERLNSDPAIRERIAWLESAKVPGFSPDASIATVAMPERASSPEERVQIAIDGGIANPAEIKEAIGVPAAEIEAHLAATPAKAPPDDTADAAPAVPFVGPKALVSQAWYDGLRAPKAIADWTGVKEATVIETLGILRNEGKVDAPDWRLANPAQGKS